MLPELLYEIYKYVAPEQYLKLNAVAILKRLVDTFRDPLEAKYIYFYGEESIEGLNHGLKYIALTNPNYRWVDMWGYEKSLIQYASRYGYLEVVKLLLEGERVDPTNNNNLAIDLASQGSQIEVIKLFLEDGRVDPSANDNGLIRWASFGGQLKVVKLLLKDKRVRQSLTGTEIKKFLKQINYKNELYFLFISIPI